ncbi:MAG: redoxin family protein [Phycisphaerales bacterium]
MKRSLRSFAAMAAGLALAFAGTAAAQQRLTVGKKAPAINVDAEGWVQGKAPSLDGDGVVVVEFWATWCGPCKKSIPHLNKLYQANKRHGLEMVGISTEQNAKLVGSFVKQKGDGMTYNVAADVSGEMNRNWMEAAGQQGIPTAFIVGRGGKILWIGHPLDEEFDNVVKLALVGKYDPVLTPKAKPAVEAAKRAAKLRNYREAYQLMDDVVKLDPTLFSSVAVERYKITLEQEKSEADARKYLQTMMPLWGSDAYSLNEVVTAICKDPEITKRDLALAMTYAEQMRKALSTQPAGALAAIAMVHASKGDYDKALESQTNAWMAAAPDDKADYKRVLDEYQTAKGLKDQARLGG